MQKEMGENSLNQVRQMMEDFLVVISYMTFSLITHIRSNLPTLLELPQTPNGFLSQVNLPTFG
jgi:hypothetical protein